MRHLRWIPALLLVLSGADAWARAGGGEHYSGGSSSDSGGSGGSDGGAIFEIVWWLLRITFEFPKVMLPFWALLIGAFVLWKLFNATATTKRGLRGIERARLDPGPEIDRALSELQSRDAAFDVDAFLERAKRIFEQVQESWFRRSLGNARNLMSDGLHRRFVVLQKLMGAEGRRDAIADVRVLAMRVLRVDHAATFDTITVLVEASMRDTEVDAGMSDEAARKAAAGAGRETFEEVWTFVRRPDRKSRPEWDISQGACPNCGAPFTGGAANKCDHCGAIVNSGAYDWVLSAITQVEAFLPRRRNPRGLDALRARDESVAAEVLEDRALLLFWKWAEAFSLGTPAVLRKVSTTGAFERFSVDLLGSGTGPRLRLPAVGGADVIAVDVDTEGVDRVHVDVRWSASSAKSERPLPRRHILTMVRATGATAQGTGLSTDRCGNCGAPVSESDAPKCEFCDHDFTTAEKDWLLENLVPYERWQGPAAWSEAPGERAAAKSERVRMLRVMAAIARADGVVDRRERMLLRSCAKRWGVEWPSVDQLLESEGMDELVPTNPARARETLQMLVDVAKIDGRVDASERALILRAAAHLDVSADEVEKLIAA